ncbi:MAG: response regulator [Candidatus Thermoplasmatota archaeon]|nr:response regulator [Candidatus Thermoplasmatota archaeon]
MKKVMVVDDEADLREMINLMMDKEGYESEMACDGADFLEKIDQFHPDLVTLDVMMPGLETKEILEKLKEKKTNSKIILLTVVKFSDEEKEGILKMGNVVDYVTKPFDLDTLMNTVKKHLNEQ